MHASQAGTGPAAFQVIVAGCGNMSRTWIKYLVARPDVEVVGLVDPDASAARSRAEEVGLRVVQYSDIEAALAAHPANLVCDVTAPAVHAHVATAAMEAGCDVFTEKPMTDSLAEARATAAVAARLGRRYSVMQNRRYAVEIRAVRQIVASGALGQIGIVNADFYRAPRFGGFRDQMQSPLLLDMAIHTFDQARFMTGRDPLSVYCHEFNPGWSWYAHGASATAIFQMSGDAVFTYRGSWCAEGADTAWESSWRLVGDRGSLTWDGAGPPRSNLWRDTLRLRRPPTPAAAVMTDVWTRCLPPSAPDARRRPHTRTTSRAWRCVWPRSPVPTMETGSTSGGC